MKLVEVSRKITRIENFISLRPARMIYGAIVVSLVNTFFNWMVSLFDWAGTPLVYYNPLTQVAETVSCFVFSMVVILISGSWVTTFCLVNAVNVVGYLKYYVLKEGVIFSDVFHLYELFLVSPFWFNATVLIVMLALITLFVTLSNLKHLKFRTAILLSGFFVLTYSLAYPETVYKKLYQSSYELGENKTAEFRYNGLYFSLWKSIIEHQIFLQQLEQTEFLENFPSYDLRSSDLSLITRTPNIHAIVMESFVHPNDFTHLEYEPDAAVGFLGSADMTSSSAFSPVFGGLSSATEFELLTGTLDFGFFSGVTFNDLGEHPIEALPRILGRLGYRSIASVPVYSSFFNAGEAYKALGFSESKFQRDFDMDDMDGKQLSNASLLQQNLSMVRGHLIEHPRTPLFNYVFLMAGHSPFSLNESRRPATIDITPDNSILRKIVNSSYYTILAVNEFLAQLQNIDPSCLVVIISDHLPGLPNHLYEMGDYRGFHKELPITSYKVFLKVFDAFEEIPVGNIAVYELPYVILSQLTAERQSPTRDSLIDNPFVIHLKGVYDRSNPQHNLCSDDPSQAFCGEAWRYLGEMRKVYMHLIKVSNTSLEKDL